MIIPPGRFASAPLWCLTASNHAFSLIVEVVFQAVSIHPERHAARRSMQSGLPAAAARYRTT